MRPCLLLLEDDPAIAQTVAYALEREGFAVDHVALIADAAARLAHADRHVGAILDIGVPDGNGLDLCRSLRGTRPALPIVLLTARGEELDRILGLELGADDYITKPFSPRELCARVRALLRRAGQAAEAGRQAGAPTPEAASLTGLAFQHDPAACRIALAGHWLDLTRLEYRLLATLLQAPGRVWSRAALLDAAWGTDADSNDRTVDTHVKTLRAKLRAAAPGSEPITTHRGMGYSLVSISR
jgi:two-component system catabolic regulation response regulator CreB